MSIFRARQRSGTVDEQPIAQGILDRVAQAHLELIPTPKAHLQFPELPEASTVSVTCSPAKDIQATLDMAAQLQDLGHTVIPHLAARMVEGPEQVAAIAQWLNAHDVRDVFVIGGDAPDPHGPYLDAGALIEALLNSNANLANVGFGGYPEGHATIPLNKLADAVASKQQLLDTAGVGGWVSTQMCFDTKAVSKWIQHSRSQGLHLPIHLGIPGVIDTTKLLTMGAKLGIGASLRYLRKNRAVVSKLAAPGGYDPMEMLSPLAREFESLDISALHVFTFNQVANTAAWRQAVIGVAAHAH
ncbi:MAG: methylenetetrahydrofolate reductase [Actinomycetota bacterium]